MKKIYVDGLNEQERRQLLTKPPFDAVELSPGLQASLAALFGRQLEAKEAVDIIVKEVRTAGDAALAKWTKLLDGADIDASALEVTAAEIIAAQEAVEPDAWQAIEHAIENVRLFHAEQLPKTWLTEREQGALLGQKLTPLARAGIYIPGGTASYPSSVIMNAVPAKVAGVEELVMAVPPGRTGQLNPYVLAAAAACGVDRIFRMGGAQAIAALAFGTATVPKVDKITGPGNIFVTLAKKAVYGHCDIDMLAGPSEILVIADGSVAPRIAAADLLSQAEHDALASSILIATDAAWAEEVEAEVAVQLPQLARHAIAAEALARNGLILIAGSVQEAVQLANMAAPEHLELLVEDAFTLLPLIKNAGAIFVGASSPEPLGDYLAGPNHVLPTGGTARFYSVLNVETFMKKSSIIAYTPEALAAVSADIVRMAEIEGLGAHAAAISVRSDCK